MGEKETSRWVRLRALVGVLQKGSISGTILKGVALLGAYFLGPVGAALILGYLGYRLWKAVKEDMNERNSEEKQELRDQINKLEAENQKLRKLNRGVQENQGLQNDLAYNNERSDMQWKNDISPKRNVSEKLTEQAQELKPLLLEVLKKMKDTETKSALLAEKTITENNQAITRLEEGFNSLKELWLGSVLAANPNQEKVDQDQQSVVSRELPMDKDALLRMSSGGPVNKDQDRRTTTDDRQKQQSNNTRQIRSRSFGRGGGFSMS